MDANRKQVTEYIRSINTDRKPKRSSTRYDDYYTRAVRKLIEDIDELSHLARPERKWKTPQGVGILYYSRISAEHTEYLERKRNKRRRSWRGGEEKGRERKGIYQRRRNSHRK